MSDRYMTVLKDKGTHALLALLMAVGLAMPLAGAMDDSLISLRMLLAIAGVILLFEAASLNRKTMFTACGIALILSAAWLFSSGVQAVSDAGIAFTLRMKGIRTAIPLVSETVSVWIAAGMALLCCFAVLRNATCIPSLMLCTAVVMIIWMTDSIRYLPWLLPALVAMLTLVMTYRYAETPVLRVLPWTVLLVLSAFFLTGNGPDDNALKRKADEIRQAVLDRLFFTEARDVFSLYSVGLSPQGPDQLGGKPNPSENPIMQVSTPKTVYLRGTVYNCYTGHGWKNTTGGRRYLWQSSMMANIRKELFDETLPPNSIQNTISDTKKVSVRMLSGSASTLFMPQRVRSLNPGGDIVPYFSNSTEIFITRNLQAGDTWEAEAPLYLSSDKGIGILTELCAEHDDPHWSAVCNTYLELPAHLEQSVKDLALEITYSAETAFEKALALQEYLLNHYKYNTDVPDHPENIDFVTSFLMSTKEGYCTYFASAMTVLCRMAGLPARYVEGYIAEPNETGEALVTGMNAHAWTEVYFSGFGWLTFDATPGRHSSEQQDIGSQTGDNVSGPTPLITPEPTPKPNDSEQIPGNDKSDPPASEEKSSSTPNTVTPDKDENEPEAKKDMEVQDNQTDGFSAFPWWLLLLLAASSVILIRIMFTSPSFREKSAKNKEQRFSIWAEEITRLLASEKLERKNGETPISFAKKVDRLGLFSESLTPAGECISRISYSQSSPDDSDIVLMRDTATLIRSELSKHATIRYGIMRVITRGKKGNSLYKLRAKMNGSRKGLVKRLNQTYNQRNRNQKNERRLKI